MPTSSRRFAIVIGGRAVGHRWAITAQHAVLDYLRSIGCEDDEVNRVGSDAAAWRGAVYTAVPEHAEESPPTESDRI